MSEERKSGGGKKLLIGIVVLALVGAFAATVKVFPCAACGGRPDESQREAVKRPEKCGLCADGKVTLYSRIVSR